MTYTRGQLEEIQAGVYVPEPVTVTFDGTGNNGKIATAAALTTALTGTNNDLTFTGASTLDANDITIEYTTDRKPTGSALEVEVSGNAITVNLLTSLGVKATGTLTSTGVFSNTETVTIGETEYTFVTALSAGPTVPYEVLIGASAAASLDNLKSAVNLTAGIGTTYSTGTEIHPTVTATTNADDSQVFEAKTVGTAGNAIATTSTAADNDFGAATLEGGEDVDQILTLASEVDSAIDAHAEAAALVTPANAGGNDGTGVVTTMAATNLTGGSDGYVELFTIEEDGIIAVTAKCTEDLVGASATIQVGLLSGDTDALIPLTTATTIDANERLDRNGILNAATPSNATPFLPVLAGQTVVATVLTASITDGTIEFGMQHRPFSTRDALKTSDGYFIAKAEPSAFAGGTSNARGDDGGTSDPLTLFNVTGVVACKVIGFCTVNLVSAGGGTLSVGTALSAAGLIASTTATDIDANEIWHDATPDASVELSSVATEKIVFQNIIETVGTADITAGQIYYLCLWRPLSPDGFVAAA